MGSNTNPLVRPLREQILLLISHTFSLMRCGAQGRGYRGTTASRQYSKWLHAEQAVLVFWRPMGELFTDLTHRLEPPLSANLPAAYTVLLPYTLALSTMCHSSGAD